MAAGHCTPAYRAPTWPRADVLEAEDGAAARGAGAEAAEENALSPEAAKTSAKLFSSYSDKIAECAKTDVSPLFANWQ